jgi:glycerophosphoryl diester phosphodiesterase
MVLIIGHRGARFEAPENTLTGFAWSNRLAIGAVEFDVRLTRDEQLVVIHDATVDRTTNGTGMIAELTLAEITALDARAQFPDWPEPATIPTFAEVIDAVDPRQHLMVEIKTDTPEREERIITGVLRKLELRGQTQRATITSFDPVAVEIVATLAPGQRRGLIGNWDEPRFLETALRLGCIQADMHQPSSSAETVREAQEHGLIVSGWPCNEPEELELLLGWGVDQICSDRPTWLIEALATAGV